MPLIVTMVASSSSSSSSPHSNERKDVSIVSTNITDDNASGSVMDHSWINTLDIPIFIIDSSSQYNNNNSSSNGNHSNSIIAWNRPITEITRIPAHRVMNRSIQSILCDSDGSINSFNSAIKEIDNQRIGSTTTTTTTTSATVRNLTFDNGVHFQVKFCAQRINSTTVSSITCFVQDTTIIVPRGSLKPTVNSHSSSPLDYSERSSVHSLGAGLGPLSQVANNLDIPLICVDLYRIVTTWNKHIERITGHTETDAVGRPLRSFIPSQQHRERFLHMSERALNGGGEKSSSSSSSSKPIEIEILSKDGKIKPLIFNISSDKDPDGRMLGLCMIVTDMTNCLRDNDDVNDDDDDDNINEKRHKNSAISSPDDEEDYDNEQTTQHTTTIISPACNGGQCSDDTMEEFELRTLLDNANTPIFGVDTSGCVNEWNKMTSEVTGYSIEECFHRPLVETFIEPSSRSSLQQVIDNALQGRETNNFELEIITKHNETRILLVNATTWRRGKGRCSRDGNSGDFEVRGVVFIVFDITEACHHDRAVAAMANELRQFIDTANAPIFGIDIDGNVNEWNRRTSEITGYAKEEAFDEPLVETFIAENMRDKVQEILDSALAGNETSNYELEFVSKTNEPIFLLVNATTRRDPENNVVGVVGVAQDVTEDRKHAQALREMQYFRASQEAKVETERNMTAYFAHELRNPLGAIDSALNAMPDDLPDAAKSLIAGMQLCTGFMSSIMNNLLDVRKMEEGKMTLSNSPVSLKKLLNNVHKMLLPSVRPGVKFEKICNTKGKDWVLGDAHRIQQVMTNVITNAIKYTVRGSVTLLMGWEGENVKFECIDTGPGIPKNEQEKLFQRFVQRGGAPGTGLGLAIAKHLVDLTGGKIRFDSDPTIKAGTTCVVLMSLPLCDAPTNAVVEESTALIEDQLSFLIIDDIKMNRMMLKRRIKKGIAPSSIITEACTGEEALEICGREKFDIIVVDQYMEEAGGVLVGTDVVFAMRRMKIDSIIIGCSGNDLGTEFFEAGADWVWQKPMPSNAKIIQDLRTSLNKRSTPH